MTVNDIQLTENTAERSFMHLFAENGLSMYQGFGDVEDEQPVIAFFKVPSRIIQFYFSLEGSLTFQFSPHYQKSLLPVNISSCTTRKRNWPLT